MSIDPVVSLARQIAKASRAADRAIARGDTLAGTRHFERARTLAACQQAEHPRSDIGAAMRLKDAAACADNSLHRSARCLAGAIRRIRIRVPREQMTPRDLIKLRALMAEAERGAAGESADPLLAVVTEAPPLADCAWNLESALSWLARPKAVR